MRYARFLLALAGALSIASAQNYSLAPDFPQQFFNSNGQPLAGGFVITCSAGLSCAFPVPSNPLTTFTDASGFTSNPDPVPLNASGRPSNGIWLTVGLAYKLVLVDSTGVIIKTVDNIVAPNPTGSSSTNYWQLSGTTIANTNGAGAGDVSLGGGLSVNNDLTLVGNIKLRDGGGSPHYANIRGPSTAMPADVSWRWPSTDAAGCLSSNGSGTLSFISCSGGGGGSPGGNNTDIQFKSGLTFGGSDNFTWDNSNQRVIITAASSVVPGLVVLTGYAQADVGFLAVNNASPGTALQYNAIQAPTGGMAAKSFTATKYIQIGNNAGTPTVSGGDTFVTGAMYCDTTASPCTPKLYNGSGWVSLATGGATSPGGADTNVQFNSGGSFGGSSNMTFTAQRLTVIGSSSSLPSIYAATGYVQSDAGFLASPGSATRYNSIQAPGGGMVANSFTATTYMNVGRSAGPFGTTPPAPTGGDTLTGAGAAGALSWDIAAAALKVYNGSTWVSIMGGGGSGTPGTPTTSIQFNSGGSFAGTANLTWNGTAVAINPGSAVAGLVIVSGFAQADTGFLAAVNGSPSTPLQYNSIQSPTGGVYAKSLRAINYAQTGSSNGIPALTGGDSFIAGAAYFDTGLGVERVYNGSTWTSLATGGVASVNTLTGALTISGTANQVNIASGGATITLSTPQSIATTSAVTFASVIANGAFNSAVSGTTTAFTTGGGAFIINGQGDISGPGGVNMVGSTGVGAYRVNGTVIVDNARNASFANVVASGAVNSTVTGLTTAFTTGTGLFSINGRGDISGPGSINMVGSFGTAPYRVNGTPVIDSSFYYLGPISTPIGVSAPSSNLYIGATGNLYNRFIGLSTGVSCGGVADGWTAISSDQFIVVCFGNTRYRASVSIF